MGNLKCRICGADVAMEGLQHVGKCTSCGTVLALPENREERQLAAYNCGTYFRRRGEYTKALQVYKKLLKEDWTDAESYWCSALCRFEILYEPDEETGEYIPKLHKPELGPFTESEDYLDALEHASEEAKSRYQAEAEQILWHQNRILSQKEQEPDEMILQRAFSLLNQEKWDDASACIDTLLQKNPQHGMAWFASLLAQLRCSRPAKLKDSTQQFHDLPAYQNVLRYADASTVNSVKRCAEYVRANTVQTQKQSVYEKACLFLEHAETPEACEKAADFFTRLGNFRDSEKMAAICRKKAESLHIRQMYQTGVLLMASEEPGALEGAVDAFRMASGYQDADQLLQICLKQNEEKNQSVASRAEKKSRHGLSFRGLLGGICILLLLGFGGWLLITQYVIPQHHYDEAEALLQQNEKAAAIECFFALGDYRDAAQRAEEIQAAWYSEAENYLSSNDICQAAFAFGGLRAYRDSMERSFALWDTFADRQPISAGGHNTVVMFNNGMAASFGENDDGQCNVGSWMGLSKVSAGWSHSVGLRTDGSAAASGYNGDRRAAVENWRYLVDISAGEWHSVGLMSDGTVHAAGYTVDGRCSVSDWREIIAVSAGRNHTVGLKADGTVVAVGDNSKGQCDVSAWQNVAAISAGGSHTVALLKDGTVVAAGSNDENQCNVSSWTDIVAVSAGYYHTVGLKSDGTVVATGWNRYNQCAVDSWRNITAISAGGWHTSAISDDGLVLCAGMDDYGQVSVPEWINEEMKNKG